MTAFLPSRLAALLAAFALIVPGLARAQMIPLVDHRENSAGATYGSANQELSEFPSAPFAYFNSFVHPVASTDDGSADATAFQVSEFFPAGINFSGATGGAWSGAPSGTYHAISLAHFGFRVDTCIDYHFDAWLDPGDLAAFNAGEVLLSGMPGDVEYQQLQNGEIHTTGRLAAGEYYVEGRSSFTSGLQSVTGPAYSLIWTCLPCQTSLIGTQPRGITVACGGTAVFSVTPTAGLTGLTFQWRRNLVPLTNSSHIAGATTQTLTINNACSADSAYYDVLLSDGTILEPSRLARLNISTISGVETPSGGPQRAFSIEAAGPNPFSGNTSFHYAAAKPLNSTIAIYNAAGARIRLLAAGVVFGSGTVTWDGRMESGVRAPAGIYFLRVEAGSIRESRKVVLLR